MRCRRAAILTVGVALAALTPAGLAADPACDIAPIKSAIELDDLLKRRAVKVMELAAKPGWKADAELARRVDAGAAFMLGYGDVGEDMGPGPEGARALAVAMKADQYRFDGWDYMDMPVEACAEHKVVVDLVATKARTHASVTFTFVGGRVTKAEGWTRSLSTGPLPAVR